MKMTFESFSVNGELLPSQEWEVYTLRVDRDHNEYALNIWVLEDNGKSTLLMLTQDQLDRAIDNGWK